MSDTFGPGTTLSTAAQRTAATANETNRIVVNTFNGVEMAALPGDAALAVITRYEGLRSYLAEVDLRQRIAAGQVEVAKVITDAILELDGWEDASISDMALAGAVAVITAGYRKPAAAQQ